MKYQHPLPYYATVYNRSLSSIKRYAAQGAPLDRPDAMTVFMLTKKDTGRAGVARKNQKPPTEEPMAFDPEKMAAQLKKGIPDRPGMTYLDAMKRASDGIGHVAGHLVCIYASASAPAEIRAAAETVQKALSEFDGVFCSRFTAAGVDVDRDIIGMDEEESDKG